MHGDRAVERLSPPNRHEIASYAARRGLNLSDDEIDDEVGRVASLLRLLDRLDEVDQPSVPIRFPDRDPGRPPESNEDPYNAILRFCDVEGADSGLLADLRLGVKDNISVAGVPMTGGVGGIEPIVPAEDAVVVERVLDAGARITAKTNLGPSELGVVRNPRNPKFWTGGSSSGSAAAVAAGLVDAALGADQGGSIRKPAAWCGLVGMKATYGLVPSYGLLYWDHTLDYIGPMTRTVADSAALLEVLAGHDWRSPQQVGAGHAVGGYVQAAGSGVRGLRAGVLLESLELAECTSATLDAFWRAARILERLGVEIVTVSAPLWSHAFSMWLAIVAAGRTAMDDSLGQGYGHMGRIDMRLLAAAGERSLNEVTESRTSHLMVDHLRDRYYGVPFAKAQNLRLELRRQIDHLLSGVDFLITPTTPTGPPELPLENALRVDGEFQVGRWLANTCPLNLTGHPALTVPTFSIEDNFLGGLQIIGGHFNERTIYCAGFAFEASI